MAVAAVLRLYDLNLVPLHHDEGVNGNFLVGLVRNGFYHYDPANYHGPTLYYFSAVIPWIFKFLFGTSAQNTYGLTTFTIRLVPALFGLGTIWLVLLLRRWLGSVGALCAAGMLAISPGAVYLSRYFIHETLFVFFTLGVVVAFLKFYEVGHPIYLILGAVSAALLFATKETAIISVAVLILAWASTQIYLRLVGRTSRKNRGSQETPMNLLIEKVGGVKRFVVWAFIAFAVFVGVNVIFYSSFFTNSKGVYDAIRTFEFWTKTGKGAHVHPFGTYVRWLFYQESPSLFLGSVGAALVLWKPKKVFALFSAFWAFGLLAAYSLIAYKTPWLTLNFIVPLALIGGYVFQVLYEAQWGHLRELWALALVVVAISGYQTIQLNFFNYDNDNEYYVYVYAHTRRDTLRLLDAIDREAERLKQGHETGITIVSQDYWPLPWYLRDYGRVGYFGRMAETNEPIIIASESQLAEMQQKFGFLYQQVPSNLNASQSFALRPGVNLILFVRRDTK
jgi:uncharacterized protein (TIGR03663 family)